MTAKKKQLLIESCEIVSKVKLPKKLKESLELSKGKAGTLIVRNIPVTILNRRNLNGRVYGTQVVQDAINAAQPLIESKQLLSQACEHPEGSYVSPTTASHVVIAAYIKPNISLTVDGKRGKYDVLFNDWEVLNTQEGKNLRALFEAECSIGVSIRGCGDLEGENVIDYEYLGTDCVGQPSSGTYTRMPVSESVKVELEDREPMNEGFVVTTSSTNVVGDLEKAAVIQANLDNATYGTVVKTHTTLDSEVDPKTGATTEITTLEAETEDEVGTLDQALQMAKNAILNPTVNVDSVTIENIQEEDEVKTGGKKEAAPEYVPEDSVEMKEDEQSPEAVTKELQARWEKAMDFVQTMLAKYENGELDKNKPFYGTNYEEFNMIANALRERALPSVVGNEQSAAALNEYDAWFEKALATPFRQAFPQQNTKVESFNMKEAKEKDPKEGKKFVLKAPNGYVSMEGNALVFKDDPKKALHFIVGKENTGLVHLSEVEKILDTMGVYEVQKYYKKDLGDISATADEQQEGANNGNMSANTMGNNTNIPASQINTTNATLTEDNPSNTRYVATVKSEGQGDTADAETVPVSATEPASILSEVGNLWKQKSKDGSENLVVVVKDTLNGAEYTYNPASNTLDPMNGGAPVAAEQPQNVDQQLTVTDPAVMEAEDDAGIEQDDNKLTMTVNPDDEEPVEIEKEFDSKAQATVAKAGLEKGDIDGSVMLNEEDSDTAKCAWCGEEYEKSNMRKEKDLGYICNTCARAISSRGEELSFEEADNAIQPGWYVGMDGVGIIGPFATEEEARKGLEGYEDQITVQYLGENAELEEAGAGATIGAGLGLPFGPLGAVAGGALGSMAQDYMNRKDPGKKTQGWKSGALLGGMVGGLPGALIGGGLQHIMTGNSGTANAIKNGLSKAGAAIKNGYNNATAQYNAKQQQKQAAAQQAQAQNGGVNDGITPADATQTQQATQAQQPAEDQAVAQQQAQAAQAQEVQAQQQAAAEQQAAAQAQTQAADANAQVLQQVQNTQAQIEQALSQLQQLQIALQNTQLNTNATPKKKVVRGKDGRFMRAEGVEEAAEMDEVLFKGEQPASDPVVEQPLQDAASVQDLVVTLANIDWDIDSIVDKASDDDSEFDASDLEMSPEQYAAQADETDLKKADDLLSLIQKLPSELTVTLKDVAIDENPMAIKRAILNAANEQTPYQINNATIVAVQ